MFSLNSVFNFHRNSSDNLFMLKLLLKSLDLVKSYSYKIFLMLAKFQHFCDSLYVYSKPHQSFIFHRIGLEFYWQIQKTLSGLYWSVDIHWIYIQNLKMFHNSFLIFFKLTFFFLCSQAVMWQSVDICTVLTSRIPIGLKHIETIFHIGIHLIRAKIYFFTPECVKDESEGGITWIKV